MATAPSPKVDATVPDYEKSESTGPSVLEEANSTEPSSLHLNNMIKNITEVDQGSEKADLEKPSFTGDTSQHVTGLKLVTLVIALCLAVFLVALDQTIIATAIPKITDHFDSISDIGWYGSAYFLTSTSLQPSFGRVYKVFNVRTYPIPRNFNPTRLSC
jgi:hypothetical protein